MGPEGTGLAPVSGMVLGRPGSAYAGAVIAAVAVMARRADQRMGRRTARRGSGRLVCQALCLFAITLQCRVSPADVQGRGRIDAGATDPAAHLLVGDSSLLAGEITTLDLYAPDTCPA